MIIFMNAMIIFINAMIIFMNAMIIFMNAMIIFINIMIVSALEQLMPLSVMLRVECYLTRRMRWSGSTLGLILAIKPYVSEKQRREK
jgi:hypothetical protein